MGYRFVEVSEYGSVEIYDNEETHLIFWGTAAHFSAVFRPGTDFTQQRLFRFTNATPNLIVIRNSTGSIQEQLKPGSVSQWTLKDNETEAEVSFRKSIEVAQRQEVRSWELRAAMSLSRLW